MDIELEKLKKLEHALCDAIAILRDWQVEEAKPEQERFIVYLARYQDGLTLCCSAKSYWETAKKFDGAKTKLFIGSEDEVTEWRKSRQKFAKAIKAWEDGKTIQYYYGPDGEWIDCNHRPAWNLDTEYRVKPECPCEEGIDSKACVGCEHSEDGKSHPFENYHCYGCDKSSKKNYRPYETVHEFIQDYQDRFPTTTPRPCYTLPFIWLRNKNKKDERQLVYCFMDLIIKMDNTYWDMNDLFDRWTYLDGSPVGMEVKE